MNIVWIETEQWPPRRGHGVEFHTTTFPEEDSLFAFLEGYDWRRSPASDSVVVMIKKPESDSEAAFLSKARQTIERAILSNHLVQGVIDDLVFAHFNA